MPKNIKHFFSFTRNNGEVTEISRPFDFADDEFYNNVEFVERYYNTTCHIFVAEVV